MNILQAIKCKIGFHQWSEWGYITKYRGSIPKSCEMERICNYCQMRVTRQEQPHSWQGWTYIADGSCDQERYCNRCQGKEFQSIHDWEDWKYKSNSCDQERECKRCHQRDTKTAIHHWGEWNYQSPDSCEQVRICSRCRTNETRQQSHIWGNWTDTDISSKQQRVCTRCNAKDFKELHTVLFQRYSGSGICDVCNREIGPGDAYLVPVNVFYGSRKYKEWLTCGPMSLMIQMAGGNVDAYIAHVRAMDSTTHSAVCSECVRLFE